MTFFQTSVSRAMWEAASAAVLARVSMPCWPYTSRTSGALSALVRIAFSVATISVDWESYYHECDHHWTAKANALVAKALAPVMEQVLVTANARHNNHLHSGAKRR
jgi:hypothetical protein